MPDTGNWAENDQFISQMLQGVTGASMGCQPGSTTSCPSSHSTRSATPPTLGRAPELSLGTSAIATHRPGMFTLHKAKQKPETGGSPRTGTSNMYVGDEHISAAPEAQQSPRGRVASALHSHNLRSAGYAATSLPSVSAMGGAGGTWCFLEQVVSAATHLPGALSSAGRARGVLPSDGAVQPASPPRAAGHEPCPGAGCGAAAGTS